MCSHIKGVSIFISERSEASEVRVQLRFQIRTYIYICMWPYVKLYAHACSVVRIVGGVKCQPLSQA